MFFPGQLLRKLDLGIVTETGTQEFKKQSRTHTAILSDSSATLTAIPVPVPPHGRDAFQCLADTASIVRFLLNESSHLPQRLLPSIWLGIHGRCKVLETSHPYDLYEIHELICFPMAQSFLVFLDPHCETKSDGVLDLESIALAPMSHVDDTGTQFDILDFRNFEQRDDLAGHARKSAGPLNRLNWLAISCIRMQQAFMQSYSLVSRSGY